MQRYIPAPGPHDLPVSRSAAQRDLFFEYNASTNLTGPGVPLSELVALYLMSGRRADLFLTAAQESYGQDKVFNLQALTKGDRWQNALALFRATGDDQWRQRTIELADAYLQRRLGAKPKDWSDPDSEGMFFWPSFVPQWIELLELYESIPNLRYLEAAHAGASAYTQFIWFLPTDPRRHRLGQSKRPSAPLPCRGPLRGHRDSSRRGRGVARLGNRIDTRIVWHL